MQAKRWVLWLLVPALGLVAQGHARAADPQVDLKVVKYDELKDAIKKLKGKVVVVDFWADT